ncbi:hypothetical protein L4F31_19925, partial [Vibrio paracholerae]|uniref:hypothetical protein n=1 Tax=Vibrio paracholerae TaxID=650003 RepID=UPI00209559F2
MAGGKDAKKAGRVTLVRDSATTAVYATAELPDRPKKDVTILSQAEIGTLGEQTFGNTNMIEKPILEYFKRQNCFPDVSITEFRKLVAGRGMDTTRVSARWGILELHFPFLRGHVSGIQEAVL